jgi:hypothetical protein
MPVEVFISYCHADERFRKELEAHLAPLTRQGHVTTWHDRDILPGDTWATRINHAINKCGVILLLVSADLVHSDYCWGVEMKRGLERHDSGDAVVVPIFIRRCDWAGAPFSHIQGLPKDAKPVDDWPKRDHAWTDVAKGIRGLVSARGGARASEPPPPPPPKAPAPPPPPPPPRSRPRAEPPPRTPGTAFDKFWDSLASEGGKQLARHGVKGLMDALASGGPTEGSASREELVAELLVCADHGRLGDLIRSNGSPVPAKKADRARVVARECAWSEGLVNEVFTAPPLRKLCESLELPTGRKGDMVHGLVEAVDGLDE